MSYIFNPKFYVTQRPLNVGHFKAMNGHLLVIGLFLNDKEFSEKYIQESLKRVSKKNVILFVLEENIKAINFLIT